MQREDAKLLFGHFPENPDSLYLGKLGDGEPIRFVK